MAARASHAWGDHHTMLSERTYCCKLSNLRGGKEGWASRFLWRAIPFIKRDVFSEPLSHLYIDPWGGAYLYFGHAPRIASRGTERQVTLT